MFVPYVMLALIASTSAPSAENKDPFEPEILVQARVIRVDYDDNWVEGVFQIDYVYSGDAKLKGKTFKHSFKRAGSRRPNTELEPPVKKGEVGIWYFVRSEDDGSKLVLNSYNQGTHADDGLYRWNMAIPVPARKIIGPQTSSFTHANYMLNPYDGNQIHYASALEWARIVETVYKIKRADRSKMLRQYVSSKNPYVTAWSIRMLAAYKPKDLIPFLEKWADDPKISVAAQVTIDDILCDRNRKKWIGSKQRTALLQRWVSGDIIETRDVLMIANHVRGGLQSHGDGGEEVYQQLDWDTWLPLMEKWVVQNHLSPTFESFLYGTYVAVDHPSRPAKDRIFAYAIGRLKTSKDPETQRFAAKWLKHLPLTDKQLVIVKDLKDKITNSRIRLLLDRAIQASTPRQAPNQTADDLDSNYNP